MQTNQAIPVPARIRLIVRAAERHGVDVSNLETLRKVAYKALDNNRVRALFDQWANEPMAPYDVQEQIAQIMHYPDVQSDESRTQDTEAK